MGRTRGTSPTQLRTLQRRRQIAELYLMGKTQWEIADALKIGQSTVSRNLAVIREDWKQSAAMDFGERRAQELAKIDHLERQYLDAWDRSRQLAEIRTATIKSKGNDKSTETTKREEDQIGDPRYLAGVQWCITKRLEILDMMPRQRFEHSGPGGGPIQTTSGSPDFSKLTDEQLRQFRDLMALLAAGSSEPATREAIG